MSSIHKLKNGRYQVSYENKFRGIARTKRTFDTRKECKEWEAAVHRDATARLLGHQRRHLFGEALARYLREESPKKKTHHEDLERARILRWPIWDEDARRWLRLEESPLDEVPAVLAKWVADLKRVERRSYLHQRQFHRRPAAGGGVWFEQPRPTESARPAPRAEVTDPALIRALDRAPGRGPFDSGTLRKRQQLVSRILRIAWKHWSGPGDIWLEQDIAGKISLEAKSAPSQKFLTYDQLLALLIAAPIHFDDAILAAAWLGWRRANVVGRAPRYRRADGTWLSPGRAGLEWSNVVFPVFDEAARLVQAGYVWKGRDETKNGQLLAQPLSTRIEQLLRLRWDLRSGHTVFHRGDGRPFLEFRRIWMSTKRKAGIDPAFRWHDLRHTFGSEMIRAGVPVRHVQELMGHASITTTQIYTHLHLEHLRDAVNAPGNKRMN